MAATEWREFCNETVPLVRFKDRVLTQDKALGVTAELYHFGQRPLASASPVWRIVDAGGKTVLSGKLPRRAAPRGKALPLGEIKADLSKLKAPAAYTLVLELQGTRFRNRWPFWLYPASVPAAAPAGVSVTASWDEAKAALAAGGRVLFLSGAPQKPNLDLSLTNVPIFWNRLMNPTRTWMLGLLVDKDHPALAGFPTEVHCDWQWTDLLPDTTAMNMQALPAQLPAIVQPIDDWNRNLRLSMLFEARVGEGRLMVTSLDLSEAGVAAHPGGPSLRRSVLDYMASSRFAPTAGLTTAMLDDWMAVRYQAPGTVIIPPATTDVADPGQIRRRSAS